MHDLCKHGKRDNTAKGEKFEHVKAGEGSNDYTFVNGSCILKLNKYYNTYLFVRVTFLM